MAEDARALQHSAAEAMKVMAVHDGSWFDETYNLLNAWLSIVPGNGAHNLRRLAVLETNLADLSFLFTLDQGDRISPHLGQEALAIFETPHQTPYAYNLHVQDVGHTLVLGATGQREELSHQLPGDARAKVRPVDDHSRSRPQLPEARHAAAGPLSRGRAPSARRDHQSLCAGPHAGARCISCTRSCACCWKGQDGYHLSDREDREVYEAIENLYVLDRDAATLVHARQPAPARARGPSARLD